MRTDQGHASPVPGAVEGRDGRDRIPLGKERTSKLQQPAGGCAQPQDTAEERRPAAGRGARRCTPEPGVPSPTRPRPPRAHRSAGRPWAAGPRRCQRGSCPSGRRDSPRCLPRRRSEGREGL